MQASDPDGLPGYWGLGPGEHPVLPCPALPCLTFGPVAPNPCPQASYAATKVYGVISICCMLLLGLAGARSADGVGPAGAPAHGPPLLPLQHLPGQLAKCLASIATILWFESMRERAQAVSRNAPPGAAAGPRGAGRRPCHATRGPCSGDAEGASSSAEVASLQATCAMALTACAAAAASPKVVLGANRPVDCSAGVPSPAAGRTSPAVGSSAHAGAVQKPIAAHPSGRELATVAAVTAITTSPAKVPGAPSSSRPARLAAPVPTTADNNSTTSGEPFCEPPMAVLPLVRLRPLRTRVDAQGSCQPPRSGGPCPEARALQRAGALRRALVASCSSQAGAAAAGMGLTEARQVPVQQLSLQRLQPVLLAPTDASVRHKPARAAAAAAGPASVNCTATAIGREAAHQYVPYDAAPNREPLPYCGRTAWRSTRVKISGADPSQLRPGYAGRVAGVVAAAGLQVAGVYVRRGCIELTVDAVDMGPGQGLGQAPAEAGQAAACSAEAAAVIDAARAELKGGEGHSEPGQPFGLMDDAGLSEADGFAELVATGGEPVTASPSAPAPRLRAGPFMAGGDRLLGSPWAGPLGLSYMWTAQQLGGSGSGSPWSEGARVWAGRGMLNSASSPASAAATASEDAACGEAGGGLRLPEPVLRQQHSGRSGSSSAAGSRPGSGLSPGTWSSQPVTLDVDALLHVLEIGMPDASLDADLQPSASGDEDSGHEGETGGEGVPGGVLDTVGTLQPRRRGPDVRWDGVETAEAAGVAGALGKWVPNSGSGSSRGGSGSGPASSRARHGRVQLQQAADEAAMQLLFGDGAAGGGWFGEGESARVQGAWGDGVEPGAGSGAGLVLRPYHTSLVSGLEDTEGMELGEERSGGRGGLLAAGAAGRGLAASEVVPNVHSDALPTAMLAGNAWRPARPRRHRRRRSQAGLQTQQGFPAGAIGRELPGAQQQDPSSLAAAPLLAATTVGAAPGAAAAPAQIPVPLMGMHPRVVLVERTSLLQQQLPQQRPEEVPYPPLPDGSGHSLSPCALSVSLLWPCAAAPPGAPARPLPGTCQVLLRAQGEMLVGAAAVQGSEGKAQRVQQQQQTAGQNEDEGVAKDDAELGVLAGEVRGYEAQFEVPLGGLLGRVGPGLMLVEAGALQPAAGEQQQQQQQQQQPGGQGTGSGAAAAAAAGAAAGPFLSAPAPPALPVLLVDDPRVARELQAAVDGWYGRPEELDELLLDFGALLRAHEDLAAAVAAAAAAGVPPAAAAGMHAVAGGQRSATRLDVLYEQCELLTSHLVSHAEHMGWAECIRWLVDGHRAVRAMLPGAAAHAVDRSSLPAAAAAATVEVNGSIGCGLGPLQALAVGLMAIEEAGRSSPMPWQVAPGLELVPAWALSEPDDPLAGDAGVGLGVGVGPGAWQLGSDADAAMMEVWPATTAGVGVGPGAVQLESAAEVAAVEGWPAAAGFTGGLQLGSGPLPFFQQGACAPAAAAGVLAPRGAAGTASSGAAGNAVLSSQARGDGLAALSSRVARAAGRAHLGRLLLLALRLASLPAEQEARYRAFAAPLVGGLMQVM